MSQIDARAIVSPSAKIGADVVVGAYAVVGDEVELGDGCRVDHHGVVQGPARLGKKNHVYAFAVVGGDPQDLTFNGERVSLVVGDENHFREFSTVNRGTVKGGGVTRIGSDNLFMAYSHIAHDCVVGSHTVFANGATLAGHVIVEDYAQVGAFCPVHQFCRVGRYAYIAAHTVITQDVPPFSQNRGTARDALLWREHAWVWNAQGFSAARVEAIEKAFRLLLRSKLNTSQALEKIRGTLADSEDVQTLVRFIESAERGLTK